MIAVKFELDEGDGFGMAGVFADSLENFRSLKTWFEGPALTITLQAIRENFASEGRDFGFPWLPLAAATQKRRIHRGFEPSHPILIQRGRLFNYATSRGGGAGILAGKESLVISWDNSKVKYATIHQTGGAYTDNSGKPLGPYIPARPWMPPAGGTPRMNQRMTDSLAEELIRRTEKNLRKRLRRQERRNAS